MKGGVYRMLTIHIDFLHRYNPAFQPLYAFDVLVHVHLEIGKPAVHGFEPQFILDFLLAVIADTSLG